MKSKVLLGVALALSLLAMPSASHADNNKKGGGHAAQRGGGGHGGGHARSQGNRGGGGHAQQRSRGHVQQRAHGNRGSAHQQRRDVRRQNVQRNQHRNVSRQERNVRRDRNTTRNRTTIRNERNVNKKTIKQNRKAENRDARRGKRIRFSNEQRNRARSYYRSHRDRFHRVARVAFPIVIGSYIPRDYTLYDIPDDYYGYVPGYEGYKYIVVGDELLIIDPETLEIVAIIPI